MALSPFVPGQRWLSQGETELGLGLVTEVESRLVKLFFPAAQDYRSYAVKDAPLSRYQLEVGQPLHTEDGLGLTVLEVAVQQGILSYRVAHPEQGECWIDELDITPYVELNRPQDRFFAGQIDGLKAYQLRRMTAGLLQGLNRSPVQGLLGARVQLLEHQFYIASQVAKRHAPRVLLADEVGLGKTIEAGLIIHQQLISAQAERVLIVVPDSLVHQWLVEMLRRFNLWFSIMNAEQYQALCQAEPELNPFEHKQWMICPQSLLVDNPDYLTHACACHWDLLVVDEAHHLDWSEQQVSAEYRAIEAIAAHASGLLLLTATPEQLGVEGHFARLRLIDPDRFFDLQAFIEEQQDYHQVRQRVDRLLAADSVAELLEQPDYLASLEGWIDPQLLQRCQLEAKANPDQLRGQLLDQLLDVHGTGRVLFRNTREQVQGFPERQLKLHLLEPPAAFKQCQSDSSLLDQLHPERLLGEGWLRLDPRVQWLQQWLLRHAEDKVLLICSDRNTAQALEEYLRLRVGIRSAVFHEQLSLVNRDRAAAYFADQEQGAQLLVCSEIGSEGRNFQFAHQLVMFDLPLNPDLIEQRIGRLDRIGQRSIVEIYLPLYSDSASHRLQRWLDQGLDAFLTPCAHGHTLFEQQYDELCQHLQQPTAHFDRFIEHTRERAQILQSRQQQGRDRLLELNSCRPGTAQEIIEQVRQQEQPHLLRDFIDRCMDYFGVEQQADTQHSLILRPGDHMRLGSFPGLAEEGMHATLNRQQALEREDLAYLSWEHPLVRGALDLVSQSDTGNTAIATLKLPGVKAGTLMLECRFKLHCPAPRALQVFRYLPSTQFRVLLSADGTDCSAMLSEQQLDQLAQSLPRQAAANLIKPLREPLLKLLQRAETLVQQQLQPNLQQARQNMLELQQPLLQRMQHLSQINPSIRAQEIEQQQLLIEQLQQAFEQGTMQLDAMLVLIST